MEIVRDEREQAVRYGLWLEYLTVGWNVVEGLASIGAALGVGSVALFAFGVDSFIESLSGSVLVWRLRAEQGLGVRDGLEQLDRRAEQLVALSLFALAGYIVLDAARGLWNAERPGSSYLGIAVLVVSMAVMRWLARAKRLTASKLGSRALEADSFQTTACWWLSCIALSGIALNAALGWWWADPVAGIGMSVLIIREAREAWRGETCCELERRG